LKKTTENFKWSREYWTQLLHYVLVGKASDIYHSLSVQQSLDYDFVKECILRGYALVPEAYRQKFRNHKKEAGQTYVDFARENKTVI